jgi:hypothetical protein
MIFETLDTRNILDRYRREWFSSSRSTNPEMFNDAILHDALSRASSLNKRRTAHHVRPVSAVRPTLRLSAQRGDRCLVLRPEDDRLSHERSRPTDEVGQVVLHGSLGEDPEAPAARVSTV